MVCKDKWAQWAQDLERITGMAAGSVDGAARCIKCDRPLLRDGRCVMGHAQDAALPAREPLAVEVTDGLLCLFDELYADGYSLEGVDEVVYARYALAAARREKPGFTDSVQGWVLNVWGDEDYEEENLVDRRVIWAETEEEAREEAVALGDPDWTLTPLRQHVEQHRPAYAPVEGSPQELGAAGVRALLDVVDRFEEMYGLDPDDPRVRAGRALLQQTAGPSPQAPERANLVIVVEGGVVQDVFSNDPNLRVTLIDHDQEEVGEDLMPYRNAAAQSMSGLAEALRGELPVETTAGPQAGHLVVVVEGGVVQEVFSDDPSVRVTLFDHDMEEEEGPLLWDRQTPAPFSHLEQEYRDAILGTREAAQSSATTGSTVDGGPVTRFRTRWYVATDEAEARRLAEIDGTPADEIEVTQEVSPVHVTGTWILWSDGRFSTAIGAHLSSGGSLTSDAAKIIDLARGSDSGYVEGGLLSLTQIAEIVAREDVDSGPSRGVYARERIERWDVRWRDGSESSLYIHTAGYFEGYQFDVYRSMESLRALASAAPGSEGLQAFPPDDFDYDPELGFVRKQE